ncbi:MAG TPA: ATP-binding protein [Solirubrobacteraceae bacterium]|nr:ATP-binding protein [Solirubrobacteraceae bacterium]
MSATSRFPSPARGNLHGSVSGIPSPEGAFVFLSLDVAGGPEAARRVRKALDRELKGHLSRLETDELRLLVTELVSNGVRHGGAGPDDVIEVRVEVGRHRIRAEVADPGNGFDAPGRPSIREDGSGGYGLVLIDRLATSWGVTRHGGTRVWLELERQPLNAAAEAAWRAEAATASGFAAAGGAEGLAPGVA